MKTNNTNINYDKILSRICKAKYTLYEIDRNENIGPNIKTIAKWEGICQAVTSILNNKSLLVETNNECILSIEDERQNVKQSRIVKSYVVHEITSRKSMIDRKELITIIFDHGFKLFCKRSKSILSNIEFTSRLLTFKTYLSNKNLSLDCLYNKSTTVFLTSNLSKYSTAYFGCRFKKNIKDNVKQSIKEEDVNSDSKVIAIKSLFIEYFYFINKDINNYIEENSKKYSENDPIFINLCCDKFAAIFDKRVYNVIESFPIIDLRKVPEYKDTKIIYKSIYINQNQVFEYAISDLMKKYAKCDIHFIVPYYFPLTQDLQIGSLTIPKEKLCTFNSNLKYLYSIIDY